MCHMVYEDGLCARNFCRHICYEFVCLWFFLVGPSKGAAFADGYFLSVI